MTRLPPAGGGAGATRAPQYRGEGPFAVMSPQCLLKDPFMVMAMLRSRRRRGELRAHLGHVERAGAVPHQGGQGQSQGTIPRQILEARLGHPGPSGSHV